jgi:myo-inositol-1(or 4)-monophosphatase
MSNIKIKKRIKIVSAILKEATPLIMQGYSVNPGGDLNREKFLELATKSSIRDLVTRFDKEVEIFISDRIKKNFPDEIIFGEEGQALTDQTVFDSIEGLESFWLIDPIDGTKNYCRAYPYFCTSIGFLAKSQGVWQTMIGLIWDPLRQELFTAGYKSGAFINENKMAVSKVTNPQVALFSSGFAAARTGYADHAYSTFRKVSESTLGVRRSGSAALDLAYVAAGRIDGYWERGLDPWDTAAGMLIVSEAGGVVSKFDGQNSGSLSGEVVVTNGHLHNWLIGALS